MADEPKRGYFGPRPVEGYDPAIDRMSDRIDELEAEIARLRAAGDALAKQASRPCRCVEAHDGAINETCAPCAAFFDWQEARRG